MKISPDVSLEDIAKQTEGFTGADLQALIYNANLEAIHQEIPEVFHFEKTELDTNAVFFKLDSLPSQKEIEETYAVIERVSRFIFRFCRLTASFRVPPYLLLDQVL